MYWYVSMILIADFINLLTEVQGTHFDDPRKEITPKKYYRVYQSGQLVLWAPCFFLHPKNWKKVGGGPGVCFCLGMGYRCGGLNWGRRFTPISSKSTCLAIWPPGRSSLLVSRAGVAWILLICALREIVHDPSGRFLPDSPPNFVQHLSLPQRAGLETGGPRLWQRGWFATAALNISAFEVCLRWLALQRSQKADEQILHHFVKLSLCMHIVMRGFDKNLIQAGCNQNFTFFSVCKLADVEQGAYWYLRNPYLLLFCCIEREA